MYPILLTLGENIDKVFSSFDLWVFHFFGSMQCTFLTYVAKFFTTFGDEGFIIPLVVLGAVLCLFKRTRKFGLSLIFAVVIGTLVTNIVVKPMVLRVRPYNTLQGNADYWNGISAPAHSARATIHSRRVTQQALLKSQRHFSSASRTRKRKLLIFSL